MSGLSGWNDPPKQTADADAAEHILKVAGAAPEGVIVASFTAAMDLARSILDVCIALSFSFCNITI